MKKGIFFDLDGTLIDSAPDLGTALNATLTDLGLRTHPLDLIRTWIGNGARELVARGLQASQAPMDQDLMAKALELFFAHYQKRLCHQTRCYDHVPSTLAYLSHKYPLALITNKPFAFVGPILQELGIDGYFQLILGGDSLEAKKPHPLPLLHACKYFGIDPNEAVMVGDSPTDMEAAKRAGVEFIALSYGYSQNSPLHATQILHSFDQLRELL
ncbi:MAG: phosphoglycolate phosphatase [Epsilonproteobacteria bacterium]|nr:phosphoglycolate phosphatase [Campylobacterota bacterium]NPA64271.1 phosphoglycolate phosphatase [Campylobacterota bacterium]